METELLKLIAQGGEASVCLILSAVVFFLYRRVQRLETRAEELTEKFSATSIQLNKDYCDAIHQFSTALNTLQHEFTQRYEIVGQFSDTLKSIQKIIEETKHHD